jgi:DNA-binding SARP family transcriptional activator/tetratricopeptide (TPR) repeat protein
VTGATVTGRTEFGLLGPLLVRRGDVVVPIPAGLQRTLLAALLLRGGTPAGVSELAETLWGGTPPASWRVSLQNCVMRLRRTLGEDSTARIITEPDGYRIETEPGDLDVERFESALTAGRAAARDGYWSAAARLLTEGLALWRGQPLAGVASAALAARELPRLAELRLQALEARVDADLHLGRHGEVIAELRGLAAAEPLRERLHGLLMTALYRDGQQAAALAAYQDARAVLVRELGTEPGADLQRLQQQVLMGDPIPDQPGPTLARSPGLAGLPERRSPPRAAPRQLPPASAGFAGREAELAALTTLLDGASRSVLIAAIAGTAGVGKTALAVRWAHQVAGRFPDGQLYVNLRGYDPGRPVDPSDALAGFLRALGVPGSDVPAEPEERAARFRSLVAGRRVLVLLDNAGGGEQVRPLLPGAAGCMAVVTSRDSLAGLVARDGAHRVDLDLLPIDEAAGLLRGLIGARAAADPGATRVLAAQCARLPLALRVAAELAVARPAVPLADLADELENQQRRLDRLDADGDPRTAVRAVFSWSCRQLGPAAARAFRLAGLHPGPDLDPYSVAALTGDTVAEAAEVLGQLARAHLVAEGGQGAAPGRPGMHDLLRAYARELSAGQDSSPQRRAALTRLLDYYLHTAAMAMDTLSPADQHRRPRVLAPVAAAPPVSEPDAARAWLDAQRTSLIAAAAYAAENGWPGHAIRLAGVLWRYLATGTHLPEAVSLLTWARRAAAASGDRAAEAEALTNLGITDARVGRFQPAAGRFQQALAFYGDTGDQAGRARALHNLGIVLTQEGRYSDAVGYIREALALYREIGDRVGIVRSLGTLGGIDYWQGRYRQSALHVREAVALAREIGDPTGEAYSLGLGDIEVRMGRYEQAIPYFEAGLATAREIGDRQFEAYAIIGLGDVAWREGRCPDAVDRYTEALAIFREVGVQAGEAEAHNGLGQAALAAGRPAQARAEHATALMLAAQIGDRKEQSRAHHGLALACEAAGEHGQARHHWEEALTRYTDLGAPEVDEVRARLAGTPGAAAR